MTWERKLTSRRKKTTRSHSIIRKLRKEGKITEEFEVIGEKVEGIINTWGKDLAEATKMECDPPQFKVKIDADSDQPLMIEPANDVAKEIFDINDVLGL